MCRVVPIPIPISEMPIKKREYHILTISQHFTRLWECAKEMLANGVRWHNIIHCFQWFVSCTQAPFLTLVGPLSPVLDQNSSGSWSGLGILLRILVTKVLPSELAHFCTSLERNHWDWGVFRSQAEISASLLVCWSMSAQEFILPPHTLLSSTTFH